MPVLEEKVPLPLEEFAARTRVRWLDWIGWVFLIILAAVYIMNFIALGELLYHCIGAGLPELLAACVMTVFLSGVLLTLTFFFLSGFGFVRASEPFQKWLGGITVAEMAGMA